MDAIPRFVAAVVCPCGRANDLLLPAAECGSEFVWHLRCGSCGAMGWFHSREEARFVRAVRETAARRGEPEGLSEEGTEEAHAEFVSALPACGCGGRYRVVRRMEDEPCLSCGRPLSGSARPDPSARREVSVPRITASR